MSYERFIGLRYLKAKRKQTFISVITLISVVGIAVGVMALIVVLSVMTGFEEDLKKKILGINAHLVIMEVANQMSGYDEVVRGVREVPGVEGATPYIYSQAMLSAMGGVVGVVVRGVDNKTIGDVTILPERMKSGTLSGLDAEFGAGRPPGIVIGSELARHLGLDVGDELNVISPLGNMTGAGAVPRVASFEVSGIFEVGMYEYDSSMAFISIKNAQSFFKLGDTVTGVEVKLADIYSADDAKGAVLDRLKGPYWARTWMEMNRNLFSALKLEKVAMFIILALIVLVAALNIISTLIMVVMEKGKDIAVLKSMGATSFGIMKIFMIEGLIIGVAGTALGTFLGVLTAVNLESIVGLIERLFDFKVLPPSIYYIDRLPSQVEPAVVVVIAVLSISISFLATLYPSWQASKLDPVEGIRYE